MAFDANNVGLRKLSESFALCESANRAYELRVVVSEAGAEQYLDGAENLVADQYESLFSFIETLDRGERRSVEELVFAVGRVDLPVTEVA